MSTTFYSLFQRSIRRSTWGLTLGMTFLVLCSAGSAQVHPCTFSQFVSGSNNTFLKYCVTENGNINYLETPAGRVHIENHDREEGYGLCDVLAGTEYYDYLAVSGGAHIRWGTAILLSQNAKSVKIARTTEDGLWTLIQTITQVPTTASVKIAMALKNNTAVARQVYFLRFADVDVDNQSLNNFDGTQNTAMAWNSIGSGTHPFSMLMQNVGTSPFPGYNGFAQSVPGGPNPCSFAANWTHGVATNIDGSLVMVYVGTVDANKSKTFTVSYKGL